MTIPWQDPSEFKEVLRFFDQVNNARSRELEPVREAAENIYLLFTEMKPFLDRACQFTCPGCVDNCCVRATIWYDFQDLLYLYFGPVEMPEQQIQKNVVLSGNQCSQLGDQGCKLVRQERPFICTWYFCPDQKTMSEYPHLAGLTEQIKNMRTKMEEAFYQITA